MQRGGTSTISTKCDLLRAATPTVLAEVLGTVWCPYGVPLAGT
jgi:hypothetical protein